MGCSVGLGGGARARVGSIITATTLEVEAFCFFEVAKALIFLASKSLIAKEKDNSVSQI